MYELLFQIYSLGAFSLLASLLALAATIWIAVAHQQRFVRASSAAFPLLTLSAICLWVLIIAQSLKHWIYYKLANAITQTVVVIDGVQQSQIGDVSPVSVVHILASSLLIVATAILLLLTQKEATTRCVSCDYPAGNSDSPLCTECGHPHGQPTPRHRQLMRCSTAILALVLFGLAHSVVTLPTVAISSIVGSMVWSGTQTGKVEINRRFTVATTLWGATKSWGESIMPAPPSPLKHNPTLSVERFLVSWGTSSFMLWAAEDSISRADGTTATRTRDDIANLIAGDRAATGLTSQDREAIAQAIVWLPDSIFGLSHPDKANLYLSPLTIILALALFALCYLIAWLVTRRLQRAAPPPPAPGG